MTSAERRLLIAIARFQLGNSGNLPRDYIWEFKHIVEELYTAMRHVEIVADNDPLAKPITPDYGS